MAEQQLQIVIDTVNEAQTLEDNISKELNVADESIITIRETVFQTQTDARSINETIPPVSQVAEHAQSIADQASQEANSAPQTQAKKDALSQAQNAADYASQAQTEAQNAIDFSYQAEELSNLGVKNVINLEKSLADLSEEAKYINQVTQKIDMNKQDAEKRLETAKESIFATTAQTQLKLIQDDVLTAKAQLNDLKNHSANAYITLDNADSTTLEISTIIENVADLISNVDISSKAASEADYNTELALNATLEAVEKAKTQAEEAKAAQARMTSSGGVLTKSKGVNYFNGKRETWYSERVLPGGGLNIPGRHTDEQGLVRDGENYICVASVDYPKGTIFETSLGMAKVYDCGCAPGTVDIYTNW